MFECSDFLLPAERKLVKRQQMKLYSVIWAATWRRIILTCLQKMSSFFVAMKILDFFKIPIVVFPPVFSISIILLYDWRVLCALHGGFCWFSSPQCTAVQLLYQTFTFWTSSYPDFHLLWTLAYQDTFLPRHISHPRFFLLKTLTYQDFAYLRYSQTKTFSYQDFCLLQTLSYQEFCLLRLLPTSDTRCGVNGQPRYC